MDRHEPPPKPDPRTWTTAEASRRLEEVLRLAREEGPQVIVTAEGAAFALSPFGQAGAEGGAGLPGRDLIAVMQTCPDPDFLAALDRDVPVADKDPVEF